MALPSPLQFVAAFDSPPLPLQVERSDDDMPRYTWNVPPVDEAVTQFVLQRSTDDGVTWVAIATILNDTLDSLVYDADADEFFYVDAAPVAGEIVRIAAENASGVGPWRYLYPPPAPVSLCNVFGVVLDPTTGKPYRNLQVVMTVLQASRSAIQSNSGVASRGQESITVASRSMTVVTDRQGRWQMDLVPNIPVEISIPKVRLVWSFRVPEGRPVLNIRDSWEFSIDTRIFGKSVRGGVAEGPLGVGVQVP